MIEELVDAAREDEMEIFKKYGWREKAPIEECWEETGPVGVTRVDAGKGDKERREHRCRLVAEEIKKDKREDPFVATPSLEAKKTLFSLWASARRARGLRRRASC